MPNALHRLPPDSRDFQLGALYDLPKLKDLPDKFSLDILGIKDQQESDFCSAMASCYASEMQEGVKLCPEYSFAVSKELSGDIDGYGQNLRDAMKAHVKVGAIEEKQAPFSLKDKDADFLRDIKNWSPELKFKALAHKKKSYVQVSGNYDVYDTIRASIYKFRKEKRAVVSGVLWDWSSKEVYLKKATGTGGGHAITYIGWEGDYLKLVNSYGKDAGQRGYHWVHRDIVNKYSDMYGAFMFTDISKEEAKYYLESGTKVDMNWLKQLLMTFINVLSKR
ncbi:TPA: hypothetical protein DEP58_01690 [Patescibacteria group bacterium]|nr:hypothetical protein [Patescibacteria group bacterium]